MTGWLRKRGHIVMNWKTRFFVLNNGFLSYYVDALDEPPYGKNQKGIVCLAGFRELSHIEANSVVTGVRKGPFFSRLNSNHNHIDLRIHLVFCKDMVNEKILKSLRAGLGYNVEGNDEEEEGNEGGNKQDRHANELLLEASSKEERDSWMAVIEAHILYIESAAMLNHERLSHVSSDDNGEDSEDDTFVYTIQSKEDFTVEENQVMINNNTVNAPNEDFRPSTIISNYLPNARFSLTKMMSDGDTMNISPRPSCDVVSMLEDEEGHQISWKKRFLGNWIKLHRNPLDMYQVSISLYVVVWLF